MEVDIDKVNEENNTRMVKDKKIEDYEKFYRKEEYKISLVNIDSSFRNKIPKNIYSTNVAYLPQSKFIC
jgi:hypothetical protein